MEILDLPDELIGLCCSSADMQTARALRLTCHRIDPLATRRLFSRMCLEPTVESACKARKILDDQKLRALVHTIAIKTSIDRDNNIYGAEYKPQWEYGRDDDYPEGPPDTASDLDDENDRDDSEVPYQFKSLIFELGRFKNLRRVEIKFDGEVCGPSNEDLQSGNHREWTEYRDQFLEQLFKSLNDPEHPAKGVRSLSIANLQDLVNQEIADSDDFKAVLGRLETLELGIATERYDASPENEITIAERHAFFGRYLAKYWLQPVQEHLLHLTLYSDCYWGYAPIFNYEALQFPKLRSLALGNFTFFKDEQLQWILSHGSTLESLSLDDCPILHAACVGKQTNPDNSLVYDIDEGLEWDYDADQFWTYDARWHSYLARIQAGLPKLKHFGLGHGDWDGMDDDAEAGAFASAPLRQAGLDARRYCIFNYGIGPSQWIEGRLEAWADEKGGFYQAEADEYDGVWEEEEGPVPVPPKCREEDRRALEELVRAVWARR